MAAIMSSVTEFWHFIMFALVALGGLLGLVLVEQGFWIITRDPRDPYLVQEGGPWNVGTNNLVMGCVFMVGSFAVTVVLRVLEFEYVVATRLVMLVLVTLPTLVFAIRYLLRAKQWKLTPPDFSYALDPKVTTVGMHKLYWQVMLGYLAIWILSVILIVM